MKDRLEIGDHVNVFFNHSDAIWNVEVLYIPCSSGDSWHLRYSDGTIYDVQQYNYMKLVRDKEKS